MSAIVNNQLLLNLSREASELYLPKEIPRLSISPTPITFLRSYVMPNIPVVIENGIRDWPALNKWTNQYLCETLGGKKVTVSVTPNGYADAPVGQNFVLPHNEEMEFSHFLTKLLCHDDNRDEVLYIQKQNSSFHEEFSELISDAAKEIPWASEAFGKRPDAVNFWMGGEHSVTSMHKDHYENMYAVIRGEKTFILHPPTDLPCIPYECYELARYTKNEYDKFVITKEVNREHCRECVTDASTEMSNISTYESSNYGRLEQKETERSTFNIHPNCGSDISMKENHAESVINSNSEKEGLLNCMCVCHKPSTVPWIGVDPLNPDYSRYPFYKYSNRFEVTLRPGDLLYLPSLWFHHVRQSNETIAINFWYDMDYDVKYNYYKFVESIMESASLISF